MLNKVLRSKKIETIQGIITPETPVLLNDRVTLYTGADKMTENVFITTYQDRISVPTTIRGNTTIVTKSGTTLTPNTEYTFEFDTTTYNSVAAMDDTYAIVVYGLTSDNYVRARILVRSGTVISVGSSFLVNASATFNMNVIALTSTTALVIYGDSPSYNLSARVLTRTGASISVGNEFSYGSALPIDPTVGIAKIDGTRAIITFQKVSPANRGAAIVASVSGTTVSFGSPIEVTDYIGRGTDVVMMSPTRALMTVRDEGLGSTNPVGSAVLLGIDGTTLTEVYKHEYYNSGVSHTRLTALDNQYAMVIDDSGYAQVIKVSNDVITSNSRYDFNGGTIDYSQIITSSPTEAVAVYQDVSPSQYLMTNLLTMS